MRPLFGFRPRSARLLFRSSVALLLACGVWLAVLASAHFLDSKRARDIRLTSSRIRIEQLEARRAEKDFLLRSLADRAFFREGKSVYLERHCAAVAALRLEIQVLAASCPPAERPEIARIEALITSYDSSFQALVEECRRFGFSGWGAEGAWPEAIALLDWEAAHPTTHPTVRRVILDLQAGHWRYLGGEGRAARQRISNDLEAVRRWIGAAHPEEATALSQAVDLYEERLASYERLRDNVGRSEDSGLLGKMRSAIHELEPALEGVVNRAAAVLEEAERRRVILLLSTCGVMAVLLALTFFSFQAARSRAGELLATNRGLESEIERRTQAVRILVEKQERLLQAERLAAIGQMVAGLAHESRNALQRGQACLERLACRVAEVPGALDLVARVQGAQDDLQRLYEEVREYSAPLQLRLEDRRLDAIFESSWEKLVLRRQGRDARLMQGKHDLDLHCKVDGFAIERVFRNLLENSLDACPDPVEINVEWSRLEWQGEPALRATVRDSGPGIPFPVKEKVFEPFYTTKTKGTGLGLAIARRLVELHRGAIEATGDGPGMAVVITLPLTEQP
jgi:signal transduction histidine kinase